MDRQSYRIIANPAPPRREISGYRQIFLSTALPRIAACTAGRPTDLNRRQLHTGQRRLRHPPAPIIVHPKRRPERMDGLTTPLLAGDVAAFRIDDESPQHSISAII